MKDRQKLNTYFLISIILLAVILSAMLCVDFFNKNSQGKDFSNESVSTVVKKDTKERVLITINTKTLQDGLENMGFLITQEYYFTNIERYSKEKTFLKFITTSSEFIYSYDGTVSAGVDFSKISITKNDTNKTLFISIPNSEIKSINIDKNTFKIYSESDSLWNPLKLDDYNASLAEFENAAKSKALANGILVKSDEQAKLLIKNFVQNFPNASDYKVEFGIKR